MIYVIIPTYNRAHTIIRAIESVLKNKNTICVVIDDGSTDNTKGLIDSYIIKNSINPNQIYYFYKKNGGVSDACNYGIDKVLGLSHNHNIDYITRLGSDDELFLDAGEFYQEAITTYKNCPIFFFKMINNGLGERTTIKNDVIKLNYKEFLSGLFFNGDDANDLINLKVLENDYYRFEKGLHGGDNIIFNKIVKDNYIIVINKPTYKVHIDTYSMTRSYIDEKYLLNLYNVQDRIIKLFKNDYIEHNSRLYGLHCLIKARFAGMLGNKNENYKLLVEGIRYSEFNIIRLSLAIISLLPYSLNIINLILKIFIIKNIKMEQSKISISKPIIENDEINEVIKVLKSGNIVQGDQVKKLEKRFTEIFKCKYAIAVNSGTAGIHAALYALGIGSGDEVITTPFTFVASANPILMVGATPIFADINEDDYLINIDEIEKKITQKTKAIIPVSLYGQVYDYKKLKALADKHGLYIIEDACQSIGAMQNNMYSGNFGDIGIFSLYATKNIMAGEGGMIVTNNEDYYKKCKLFRHHGQIEGKRYEYYDMGYNYRMTDLHAAIGNIQIERLSEITEKRIFNANYLIEGLKGLKGIILPKTNGGNKHVFHQFTIRITDDFPLIRDDLISKLKVDGIETNIYYPEPICYFPQFVKFGYQKGDMPIAEKISKDVFSLPIHPSLNKNDLDYIISKIKLYSLSN